MSAYNSSSSGGGEPPGQPPSQPPADKHGSRKLLPLHRLRLGPPGQPPSQPPPDKHGSRELPPLGSLRLGPVGQLPSLHDPDGQGPHKKKPSTLEPTPMGLGPPGQPPSLHGPARPGPRKQLPSLHSPGGLRTLEQLPSLHSPARLGPPEHCSSSRPIPKEVQDGLGSDVGLWLELVCFRRKLASLTQHSQPGDAMDVLELYRRPNSHLVLLRRYTDRCQHGEFHGPTGAAWEEGVLPISCLPESFCCCPNRRGQAYHGRAWVQEPSPWLGRQVKPRSFTYALEGKDMWGVRVLLEDYVAEDIQYVTWHIPIGLLGEAGELEHRVEGERGLVTYRRVFTLMCLVSKLELECLPLVKNGVLKVVISQKKSAV